MADDLNALNNIRASVLKRFSKLIKPNVLSSGVGFGRPQRTPDGREVSVKYWGITRVQLRQLHQSCREQPEWSDSDDVNSFVEKFVKPMTKGTGMGVSLLLNQHVPREVNFMISHAWVENTKDFFDDIDEHMQDEEVAFICFLALYQESIADIQAQLGTDVRNGPFADIISNVKRLGGRMLVVPNECLKDNGQGLYSRMWCAWEVYCAAKAKVAIDFTHRRSGEHLLGSGTCSIRNARCGHPSKPMNADEKAIRTAIEEEALNDRIGVLGKVQFGAIAAAGCFVIGPEHRFHTAGCLIGIALLIFIFFLSVRYGAKSDGYDRVDETIERIASGGVRAMGFFRMGSSGMMNIACALGVLADIASRVADRDECVKPMYDETCEKRLYGGVPLGVFCGVVIGGAMFLHWGSKLANATVFTSTVSGALIGHLAIGAHEAMSASLVGLCVGIGAVYFNRSWKQRIVIVSCTLAGGFGGFLKFAYRPDGMVLRPAWLHKDYLGGVCIASEVPSFKAWKLCFYSMLGLILGIIATSSSHSAFKRAVRVISLFGGIVIINLITNADFTFYGGPMLIATLAQRVGIAATRVASMAAWQQIIIVTGFLVGSSAGALICNSGGCLIGGVLGNLIGTVLAHVGRSGTQGSQAETVSLAMALCGDAGIEMKQFHW